MARLLVALKAAAVVAVTEGVIMLVLPQLAVSDAAAAWLDPVCLTVVSGPLTYLWVVGPFFADLRRLHGQQALEATLRQYEGQLRQAFEMAYDEPAAVEIASYVLQQFPMTGADLLLADSSDAHLEPAFSLTRPTPSADRQPAGFDRAVPGGAIMDPSDESGRDQPAVGDGTGQDGTGTDGAGHHGAGPVGAGQGRSAAEMSMTPALLTVHARRHSHCPVDSPWSCPAVVAGRTHVFPDAGAVSACPKLRLRPDRPAAAACLPVTSMGRALGVLHVTADDAGVFDRDSVDRLRMLAGQAGAGIGLRRTVSRTQVQADTDSLTGLLNRRSLEDKARTRLAAVTSYAVLMVDLDHFKQLNDVHGHDAGDRAIRATARILRQCTRDRDLVGRYGGEEFLVVLPGADHAAALTVAERIRQALAHAAATSHDPLTTASIGLATAGADALLHDTVRDADRHLLEAKRAGRNRTHTAPPNSTLPSHLPPAAHPRQPSR